ncbi:unnamed protein product [Somion occarium]|uniref:Protein kinase domain-containing protein n=1 Tax=Somion occarium TaxID=3059160 RepID=A0ABP1DGT5_9APHY
MNPPDTVPANAFVNVTLSGATKNGVPIHLQRGVPRPNKPFLLDGLSDAVIGKRPPKRLPSKLPPPGDMTLHLSLGTKIGRGRVGRVYEATVDLKQSSPELTNMVLPPLVVKVSRRHDAKRLAREAFYYEEMECLQGCAIPRYYGLYQTTIPPATDFLPWTHDKVNRRPGRHGDYSDESDSESESEPESKSSDKDDDDDAEDEDADSQVYSSDEEELPTPTILSILILERVGGRIPLRKPLSDDVHEDIHTIYADFGRLGVDHCDIRYFNILRAPSSSESPLPSLPSPFTQRTYNWRVVDFDNACKSNMNADFFRGYHHGLLVRLLTNLPWGFLCNTYDIPDHVLKLDSTLK